MDTLGKKVDYLLWGLQKGTEPQWGGDKNCRKKESGTTVKNNKGGSEWGHQKTQKLGTSGSTATLRNIASGSQYLKKKKKKEGQRRGRPTVFVVLKGRKGGEIGEGRKVRGKKKKKRQKRENHKKSGPKKTSRFSVGPSLSKNGWGGKSHRLRIGVLAGAREKNSLER